MFWERSIDEIRFSEKSQRGPQKGLRTYCPRKFFRKKKSSDSLFVFGKCLFHLYLNRDNVSNGDKFDCMSDLVNVTAGTVAGKMLSDIKGIIRILVTRFLLKLLNSDLST